MTAKTGCIRKSRQETISRFNELASQARQLARKEWYGMGRARNDRMLNSLVEALQLFKENKLGVVRPVVKATYDILYGDKFVRRGMDCSQGYYLQPYCGAHTATVEDRVVLYDGEEYPLERIDAGYHQEVVLVFKRHGATLHLHTDMPVEGSGKTPEMIREVAMAAFAHENRFRAGSDRFF